MCIRDSERIRLSESAETAKQIGIPDKGPTIGPYIALVAITVVAVGTGAFFVGRGLRPTKADDAITGQITVGAPRPETPAEKPTDEKPPVEDTSKDEPQSPEPIGVGPEAAWLSSLQQKTTEKLDYVALTSDPRSQSASVTVRSVAGETSPVTATRTALDVFRSLPAFTRVTVRIVQDNSIVFVADMSSEAAKTAEAAISGGDTVESQSQVMLSNVWTPASAATTGGSAGG